MNTWREVSPDPVSQALDALDVRLLGPLLVYWGGRPVDVSGKISFLIMVLATAPGHRVTRERLAGMLWGDKDEHRGLHNLRQMIARLRKLEWASAFLINDRDIGFDPARILLDTDALLQAAASDKTDVMRQALRACRGSFCKGLIAGDDELDDNIRHERDHYDGLVIDSALLVGNDDIVQGNTESALEFGRLAISIDRYREDGHRLIMRALVQMDRRSEAIRHYDTLAAFLEQEIDTEPDELTQSLAASLKLESNVSGASVPAAQLSAQAVLLLDSAARQANEQDGPAILFLTGEPPAGQGFDQVEVRQWLLESERSLVTTIAARRHELILHVASMIKAVETGLRLLQKIQNWNASAGLHSTGPAQHLATPDHPDIRTARQICRLASPGRLGLSLEVRERLGSSYAFAMEDSAATRLPSELQHQRLFLAEPLIRSEDPVPRGLDVDPVPAVAVIPFLTLTTDAAFQNLGDVIAEELIASLCRRKEIRVISRLSTKAFKADHDNSRDIRHFLGASFGATGTCTIVGDQLKVLVEFVDFGQNETIWTETLRCPLGAALATDGIVDEVAARIIATILRKSVEIVRQQPLPKLENSALLLGAITLMHQLTPERFAASKTPLNTLAERCPRHPAPHAWLGMYQLLKVSQGWSANPADDARLGRESTARALDADPDHAVALSVSAHISTQFEHDFESGGSALERALLVEPSNGLGWLFSSVRHAFLGEGSDAIKAAAIASSLSPLDPRRWFYDSLASTAALGANDCEAAIALGKRSLQGNGLHTSTYRALIIAMQLSGRHSDASAMAIRLMRLQPQFSVTQYRRIHPTLQTPVGSLWADALRAAGLPE